MNQTVETARAAAILLAIAAAVPAFAQDGAQTDTSQAVQAADWADTVTITINEADDSFHFHSNGIPDHGFAEKYLIPNDVASQPFADNSADQFTVVNSADYFTETTIDTDITTRPQYSESTTDTSLGRIGVALSGAQLFNDYENPDKSVVAMDDNAVHDHVAFLDECNGHTLVDGTNYHYHGIPVCLTERLDVAGEHSHMLGVMEDGFPVYANLDVDGATIGDDALDECSGHFGPTPEFPDGIYHYHLTDDEAPYMVDCYHGEIDTTAADMARPEMGGGGPDLTAVAADLGITVEALRDALGNDRPPNFAAAAEQLGISEEALVSAMPPPPN